MSINADYINALLADAAYAEDLLDGLKGTDLQSALTDRMTPTLADFISAKFSVCDEESGLAFFFKKQDLPPQSVIPQTANKELIACNA